MADPHGPEGEEGENGEHAGWRFRGRSRNGAWNLSFHHYIGENNRSGGFEVRPQSSETLVFLVALFTELFLHKMLKIIVTLNTGLLVYLMIDVTK